MITTANACNRVCIVTTKTILVWCPCDVTKSRLTLQYFNDFTFNWLHLLSKERMLPLFLWVGLARANDQPNIVFIMLDDLGWANVGFHNPASLTTPFLDKMTKSEHTIELTNAYSTHRCSPSRAAALTGVYPHRFGMGAAALKQIYMPEAMDKNMTILPKLMKEGGYSTHMVGK